VVAAGTGTSGECRVEDWVRVVGVAAGNVHTASNTGRSHSVGLGAAGTVMATGWNGDGQCDVASWRGVALVAAGWRRILGLVKDGTVAAAGRLREGACDVSQWREVVALACGDWHSVGLRADGTTVAVGNDRRGQCAVDTWREIVAVAAGYLHTVGLTNDGRVFAVGDRSTGASDVDAWRHVVAVAAGSYHTVAVTAVGSWPRVATISASVTSPTGAGSWRWRPDPPTLSDYARTELLSPPEITSTVSATSPAGTRSSRLTKSCTEVRSAVGPGPTSSSTATGAVDVRGMLVYG
jgi:Regulator of chromosome condensation (RCC1) repeat